MRAVYLKKYGVSDEAFEIRETTKPLPGSKEVLIRVETFGLNFADVMARRGLYGEAPTLPCVLGYEVVGKVEATGSDVKKFREGQKVVALTRFGGYAEYAVSDERGVMLLPDDCDNAEASCLATQYITAYYACYQMANLQEGEQVLIHAAAGGVGIALTQLAKLRNCIVYGTAGTDSKLDFLKTSGVDFPVNYRTSDFVEEIVKINLGKKLDVVFDPIGGKNFKQSRKLLGAGGRIVTYGASDQLNGKKGIVNNLRLMFGFGFMHPVGLIMSSTSVIGVNLLRLADHKPDVLQQCLSSLADLYASGKIKPYAPHVFHVDQIADAHHLLEIRKSIGKVTINW